MISLSQHATNTASPNFTAIIIMLCSCMFQGVFKKSCMKSRHRRYTLGVWIKCTYTLGVNIRLLSAGYRLFLMFFISFTSIVWGRFSCFYLLVQFIFFICNHINTFDFFSSTQSNYLLFFCRYTLHVQRHFALTLYSIVLYLYNEDTGEINSNYSKIMRAKFRNCRENSFAFEENLSIIQRNYLACS